MEEIVLCHVRDLCILVRCAIREEKPDLSGMDLTAVFRLAKAQSLAAITYMGLAQSETFRHIDSGILKPWKEERDKAVRRNLLFAAERDAVCRRLDAAGIWYMPLKGSLMASLYPKIGMRQMADVDILFDAACQEAVRSIMEELGYHASIYGMGVHDEYEKAPIFHFEMHTDLFSAKAEQAFYAYYAQVKERLLPEEGCRLKFSDEDFYLFFLAHGYKHFSFRGNGLRFLVDLYVWLSAKKALDDAYLKAELTKLDLTEFERTVRTLSMKLFETGESLTHEETELVQFCVQSGTYGTEESQLMNHLREIQPTGELKGTTRLKYFWRRLWPDRSYYANAYPFLNRYWILKPFFLIGRFWRGVCLRGGRILREFKMLFRKR